MVSCCQRGGKRQRKDNGAITKAVVIGEKRRQKEQRKTNRKIRPSGKPFAAPGKRCNQNGYVCKTQRDHHPFMLSNRFREKGTKHKHQGTPIDHMRHVPRIETRHLGQTLGIVQKGIHPCDKDRPAHHRNPANDGAGDCRPAAFPD